MGKRKRVLHREPAACRSTGDPICPFINHNIPIGTSTRLIP